MVRFHVGASVASPVKLTQPESNPSATGVHGAFRVDCVTEWFPGDPLNRKVIVFPFVTFTLLGLYTGDPPGPPTSIICWPTTKEVVARAAKKDVTNIVENCGEEGGSGERKKR